MMERIKHRGVLHGAPYHITSYQEVENESFTTEEFMCISQNSIQLEQEGNAKRGKVRQSSASKLKRRSGK